MEKTRKHWIDCVKGIGCILVVWGHAAPGTLTTEWTFSFHMPLFFMISGILLAAYADERVNRFELIWKKAKQLLYPYFAFSGLVAIYLTIVGNAAGVLSVIKRTVSFEGYSTLWFLPTLFLAESLVIYFINKNKKTLWLIGMLLVTVSCIGNYIINVVDVVGSGYLFLKLFNIVNRSMIGAVFVLMGYLISRSEWRNVVKKYKVGICLGCLAINMLCFWNNIGVDMHYSRLHNPILFYLSAITGSGFVILLMCIVEKNRILEYWGRNSLAVMVTHLPLPILALAKETCKKVNLVVQSTCVNAILIVFITMLLEVVIIELINRAFPFLLRWPVKRDVQRKKS